MIQKTDQMDDPVVFKSDTIQERKKDVLNSLGFDDFDTQEKENNDNNENDLFDLIDT